MGVIVVAGDIGRGATLLKNGLANEFGWQALTIGEYFRKYAKEKGFDLEHKELFPVEFELETDNNFQRLIRTSHDGIFEGHYQGWLARDFERAFRILVYCDQSVAVKRCWDRDRETEEKIVARQKGHREKFRQLYGEDDYFDPRYFHLTINTGVYDAAETLQWAVEGYQEFQRVYLPTVLS